VAERLVEGGVVVAARTGRVRLSLHLYNTAQHVSMVVGLLRDT
jgi:selenocysteine lyase/cysteine desulfurase